jgi:hypothetical protein
MRAVRRGRAQNPAVVIASPVPGENPIYFKALNVSIVMLGQPFLPRPGKICRAFASLNYARTAPKEFGNAF